MFLMADRKKTLNQIMGDEKKEGGGNSALSLCMREFLDAVKSDDVEGAVAALRSCYAQLANEELPDDVA